MLNGHLAWRSRPLTSSSFAAWGAAAPPGFEFYGLIDGDFENSAIPDAIWLTLDERRTAMLPASLILVSDTGDGGYYGIDVSQTSADGDSPVVKWWPWLGENASDNRRPVASDFGAFLLKRQSAGQVARSCPAENLTRSAMADVVRA